MQDKLIALVTPKTTDQTEFNQACEQFKAICHQIGQLINVEDFKGGFDEILLFQNSDKSMTNEGLALAIKWTAANSLCTYLASKLGIGQPEWWKICWNI